ncbi:zinc finger protein ZFP2-like [Pectinophora gossypiella]|nr:zinc finger protein ZFP2-like [Pectinophora gossypiella]
MLEMAEVSALNSIQLVKRNELTNSIKTENEVKIKPEPLECAVCVSRSTECVDICATRTGSGTLLTDFLCKFTHSDLVTDSSKYVCKSCHDLINVLEQAELEYLKLKEAFEAILSKNPLFDQVTRENIVNSVKEELSDDLYEPPCHDDDSEDEPLAVTKKKRHRKVVKRKKKVCNTSKRKARAKKENYVDNSKQKLDTIQIALNPMLQEVKKEDSMDGSLNTATDSEFKLEIDYDDEDDDSTFMPELSNGEKNLLMERRKSKSTAGRPPRKKEEKTVHQCDQCDAKYTSFKRLEIHKEKHLEGKPPFICEVCGAHYKHKRACDIHVALHKGISDWKCEECNKLFPSKGALQRHNNIHTGKLNYQCDLCGKSFIHTSSFKMHKLSHSGEKPHACDVCGLALMTRSHLKRHKRIHSGEKRHECGVCGKRFSERYNLVAHSKAHEGAADAVPPQPRRRLFRCTFCQDRFERRYMLERHVAVAHNRTLERAPATPRNTMSKLLKAQAAARAQPGPPHTPHTPASDLTDTKEERSPDSRASSIAGHKLQLSSVTTISTAGSWSGAYAAEFGLRPDFPH